MDKILGRYEEAIGEKYLLAKLLFHVQGAYEESKMLLCHFLSEEDFEQLISKHNLFKDLGSTVMVEVRYLHVVYEHVL